MDLEGRVSATRSPPIREVLMDYKYILEHLKDAKERYL